MTLPPLFLPSQLRQEARERPRLCSLAFFLSIFFSHLLLLLLFTFSSSRLVPFSDDERF